MWRYIKEMRAAYSRWEEYWEAAVALRKALRFFTDRELVKALQRWQEFVVNQRDFQEKVALAAARFFNRTTGAALARWVEWKDDTLNQRHAGERAVRFLLNRAISGAFARWQDYATVGRCSFTLL